MTEKQRKNALTVSMGLGPTSVTSLYKRPRSIVAHLLSIGLCIKWTTTEPGSSSPNYYYDLNTILQPKLFINAELEDNRCLF